MVNFFLGHSVVPAASPFLRRMQCRLMCYVPCTPLSLHVINHGE